MLKCTSLISWGFLSPSALFSASAISTLGLPWQPYSSSTYCNAGYATPGDPAVRHEVSLPIPHTPFWPYPCRTEGELSRRGMRHLDPNGCSPGFLGGRLSPKGPKREQCVKELMYSRALSGYTHIGTRMIDYGFGFTYIWTLLTIVHLVSDYSCNKPGHAWRE